MLLKSLTASQIVDILLSKLIDATDDLKKYKICGTCKYFTPRGRHSKCKLKSLTWLSSNYAGCSQWLWRGFERSNGAESAEVKHD